MAEQERPYDAGDEGQVKRRKTREQIRKDQEKADWNEVLATKAGMRVLWRILGRCGIHEDPFHQNALTMAAKVGEQRVGRFIEIEIAGACPHKFLEMQLLAKEEIDG